MGRLHRYTKEVRQLLSFARDEASLLRHRVVGTEHLLLAMLKQQNALITGLLTAFKVDLDQLRESIEYIIGRGNKAFLSEPTLGATARAILLEAEQQSMRNGNNLIELEHILLAILNEPYGSTATILAGYNIDTETVNIYLARRTHALTNQPQDNTLNSYEQRYHLTPVLNEISRDLTLEALLGRLDPLIGREEQLERVMQILSRRSKNNPVLIGPAGVGKTAIMDGLALAIIQDKVPDNLKNCRIVSLDVGMLTVGTRFRGDFEERIKRILHEVVTTQNIIVAIDELHTLIGSENSESSNHTANLFKPLLARGEFRCIGATTAEDYRKSIEADPALERRFQPIQVPETSEQETLDILLGLSQRYAEFHQVIINDDALRAAIQLSSRYIADRHQPDKALDLLDEAASRLCVQHTAVPEKIRQLRSETEDIRYIKEEMIAKGDFAAAARLRNEESEHRTELQQAEARWFHERSQNLPVVSAQQIAEIVSLWTGIPVAQITSEEAERLLQLEDELHKRVIGQDQAIELVARTLRRSRTNLRDGRRPIGSFLFVGPTGVGKTELARALAATLFADEQAMIKLDMSEFMESHLISRLIGAPPGYLGFDQGGQLTEAVRRQPYCIILFDEIEKAHPKVFDLLLQIFDDGCLTDSRGRKVNFKHTLIIMTSNLGTGQLEKGQISFTPLSGGELEQHKLLTDQIMPELKSHFRPELLNRLDDIIIFSHLKPEELHKITDLLIAQTRERMKKLSIELQVTEAARAFLASRGYDPLYGARPLRRIIQTLLDDMLAEAILQEVCQPGDTVCVDVVEDKLSLQSLQLAYSNPTLLAGN